MSPRVSAACSWESFVPTVDHLPGRADLIAGPGQPSWVPRPRLSGKLTGAGEGDARIVMVSGPGGAGKSVLASQVLDADDRVRLDLPLLAWLDEPAALTRAVVEALETVGPPAPNLHSCITAREPGLSTIVLPALDRLVRSRTTSYVLVIDDLHLLRGLESQKVIRTLCEATPPGSTVILLSRDVTPAWLSRARAEGRLIEVTGDDLSFDAVEAGELLRRLEVDASAGEVADIVEGTQGWAVAIYLTGLALRRDDGSRPFATSERTRGSSRFIEDYISTEILPPLEPDLQDFLARTSVLDELTPALCDAVLDRDDSAASIARLQEHLQLVIPLDGTGSRVRYHHLLGEALRAELSHRTPGEVPALHARAARWYAEHGDLDAAIRHAKATDDLAGVGHLVWSGTIGCIGSGETDRLATWLRDLPDTQIARDPWLSLSAAWLALQRGENDRMNRWILHSERHAGADWRSRVGEQPYPASVAVIVAVVGRTGLGESLSLCEAADRGMPPDEGFRSAAAFIHGVALTLNHRTDEGLERLAEAERLARALDVPIVQADSLAWRGVLAMAAGDHRAGQQLITRARRSSSSTGSNA